MKKILSILAVSFLMMGMVACDVIDEQDYIKNNGGTKPPEQPGEPGEPGETGDFTTSKCVLLEDYTGVRCPNCPEAGEIALQIQEQYHHQVVVLAVHAGGMMFSNPAGGFHDFRTTEGDAWRDELGIQNFPSGTINRKQSSGTFVFNKDQWANEVATALQEEPTVAMASNIEYDEANRNLKVDVTSKALVELPDTYRLTVCIMEDSIVGKQILPSGIVDDFMHRHIFRTTMNGEWGEAINEAPLAPEEVITKSYSLTLNEAYNAEQCYIVAYVHNDANREVLQVIEKKIK